MRLAAQMRGGFYPAAREAVAHAARFLQPPQHGSFAILDPCAGEGAAIRQLAEILGCPRQNVYAIELDDSRADVLHQALPDAHLLAPASFFGCRATPNSFSFIWLNPPFDDSLAGRRVEQRFLVTATDWLMPGGVMALVCPENVAGEGTDTRRHFATYYEHCRIVPFPAAYRPFNEVIVFGQKRMRLEAEPRRAWIPAPDGFVYQIPSGPGLRIFQKFEPTEPELQRMLAGSPLRSHLTVLCDNQLPSPPLPLGTGHVALLLASGHLDGVVHPAGGQPHVVRGTARKREYVAEVSETENDDGSTTKRTTIAERIELIVRTVGLDGCIRTFQEADAGEEATTDGCPT